MNFLADESCAASVIRALREAGHNVLAIAEIAAGASDEQVLDQAAREERVLLTEDLDFGNLVFARGLSAVGVILIRFRAQARRAKPATVVEAVSRFGSRLRNAFVVVEPGRVRISPRS
jgi:predicted nuclease of predicted toxin-antitoxin system